MDWFQINLQAETHASHKNALIISLYIHNIRFLRCKVKECLVSVLIIVYVATFRTLYTYTLNELRVLLHLISKIIDYFFTKEHKARYK